MILGTIIAAALLLLVSIVLLADACQPMSNLHVCDTGAPSSGHPPGESVQQGPYDEFSFDSITSDLPPEDRDGFLLMWVSVREEFDENPCGAVLHADLLISDLIEDSRRPAATPFTDPLLNATYQRVHQIALQASIGNTPVDELKRAMDLFGLLLNELLGSISGTR